MPRATPPASSARTRPREGEAVVQSAFDIEELAKPKGHVIPADDGCREHRVGRAERRTEKERLGPGQPSHDVGSERREAERKRHAEQQRLPGQAPCGTKVSNPHPHPIGEQHAEQGQLRQSSDQRIPRQHGHEAQGAIPDEEPRPQEQDGRGEHAPVGQSRDEDSEEQGHRERENASHDALSRP